MLGGKIFPSGLVEGHGAFTLPPTGWTRHRWVGGAEDGVCDIGFSPVSSVRDVLVVQRALKVGIVLTISRSRSIRSFGLDHVRERHVHETKAQPGCRAAGSSRMGYGLRKFAINLGETKLLTSGQDGISQVFPQYR